MKKTIFTFFVISMITGFLTTHILSEAHAGINESDKEQKSKKIDGLELRASQLMENAEKGDIYAQYKLSFMYADGNGVPQNMDQAASWLLKAANQGHLEAQRYLAFLYESGKWGFPKDKDKAKYWSNLGGRFPSSTAENQGQEDGSEQGIFFVWFPLFAALILVSLFAIAFIIHKKKIKTIDPTNTEPISLDSLEIQFDQADSTIAETSQTDIEPESDITFEDLSDSGDSERKGNPV